MPNILPVSIVIPTFDAAEYCVDAVRSCFYPASVAEVILIEDGSRSHILEKLHSVLPLIPVLDMEDPNRPTRRIRFHWHENQGAYATRLIGAKFASEPYLKFLDHDDRIDTNVLEQELSLAESQNADVVMSDWLEVEAVTNNQQETILRRHTAPSYKDPISDFLEKGGVYTGAALYRAELFADLEPISDWQPHLKDDWAIFAQICLYAMHYSTLHANSYQWRRHPEQQTASSQVEKNIREIYQLLEWFDRQLTQRNLLSRRRQKALAAYYAKNAVILHQYNPQQWRKVAQRIDQLDPNTTILRGNFLLKFLTSRLGLVKGINSYGAIKKYVARS